MLICSDCGFENPDGDRFCRSYGASLKPVVERRKLVTSVFCYLSGSTALGGQVDAESVFESVPPLTRVSPVAGGFRAVRWTR
jgi:hypothetical protein